MAATTISAPQNPPTVPPTMAPVLVVVLSDDVDDSGFPPVDEGPEVAVDVGVADDPVVTEVPETIGFS